MRRLLLAATAAVAVGLTTTASHATVVIYSLSTFVGSGTPQAGPYGTVTLNDHGGPDTTVSVRLQPGIGFVNTGAGKALGFDLAGSPSVTVSGVTSGFTFSQATDRPYSFSGSGQWTYELSCNKQTCGTGGNAPYTGILSFTLHDIAPSAFLPNASGYHFAADVCTQIGVSGRCSGPTGVVAAVPAVQTSSSAAPVPEPMSMAILGTGLILLGFVQRWRA